ncbi:MAG: pyridoxal phosphate-dependent aminotransferase [Acidimicrobiales bacterium]
MIETSETVALMARSGIREIFDLAHTIPDCIHLEAGEPNFPTPAHICEAAAAAAREGHTKYTPNAGIPELREAIAHKVTTRNGVPTTADQVTVTPGGVAAAYSAISALTDPGDGVLIADPSWPNFRMMAEIQSLQPQYFPTYEADAFVPRAENLERCITDSSKVLILNSPSNPTGAVIPGRDLSDLIDVAREHNLWVISDEVYDAIGFGEPQVSAGTFNDDGRVVLLYSFSKSYAMTCWRCGYSVAEPGVAAMITKCQEPTTSCVNSPTQWAAIAALTGSQDAVEEMRLAYQDRRDRSLEILATAGIKTNRPGGAFYIWIDISASGLSGMDFARRLATERKVAIVPGTAFGPGSGDFVRISLATAPDLLFEAVGRLGDAVTDWGA